MTNIIYLVEKTEMCGKLNLKRGLFMFLKLSKHENEFFMQ